MVVPHAVDPLFAPGISDARFQAKAIERCRYLFIREVPGHTTDNLNCFHSGTAPVLRVRFFLMRSSEC
jgi:hypothetical protein